MVRCLLFGVMLEGRRACVGGCKVRGQECREGGGCGIIGIGMAAGYLSVVGKGGHAFLRG